MSETTELRELSDLVHWERIFEMLSIERAEQFFPDIGLDLFNADAIRKIARQHLEQLEHVSGDNKAERALLQHTVADISAAIGDKAAQHLYHLGTKTTPWSKPESVFLSWRSLLLWLVGFSNAHRRITLPSLDVRKLEAVIRAVRANFWDHLTLDDRIEEAEHLPRSGWEEHIYAHKDVGYSPLTLMRLFIDRWRFQNAWASIIAALTAEELRVLVQWGKDQASLLGIQPDTVELPSTFDQ